VHHDLELLQPGGVVEVLHGDVRRGGGGQVDDQDVGAAGLGDQLLGSVDRGQVAGIGDHLRSLFLEEGAGARAHEDVCCRIGPVWNRSLEL
jgi:hypothetical protein